MVPRPWKATREWCTHGSARSRMIFPPAPLPCRPDKLRPATADARAVAVARRQAIAPSCFHRRYNGASALLPPPLPRRPADRGGSMLSSQQPDRYLLCSVRRESSLSRERTRYRLVRVPPCRKGPGRRLWEEISGTAPSGREIWPRAREQECLWFANSSGRCETVSPLLFLPIAELSACVCARVALFIEPTRYCV